MTNGQRTIVSMLAIVVVMLGLNLIVKSTPAVMAQTTQAGLLVPGATPEHPLYITFVGLSRNNPLYANVSLPPHTTPDNPVHIKVDGFLKFR